MSMYWLQSTGASSCHSPQSSFATQQKIQLSGFQTLVRSMLWKESLLAPSVFFFLRGIDLNCSSPFLTLSHHLLYVQHS